MICVTGHCFMTVQAVSISEVGLAFARSPRAYLLRYYNGDALGPRQNIQATARLNTCDLYFVYLYLYYCVQCSSHRRAQLTKEPLTLLCQWPPLFCPTLFIGILQNTQSQLNNIIYRDITPGQNTQSLFKQQMNWWSQGWKNHKVMLLEWLRFVKWRRQWWWLFPLQVLNYSESQTA